ncbi:uncharacterized protein [Nicotiana tomentosiformis]|uniref:uncharacterized protein n=1 Tax=Nicotiana tomentosiformis TaxID=4098 RepID=UPI00388C777C
MDGDTQKLLDRCTRLHPPVFGGERHKDVQDFIDRCRDRLHNIRILESYGVDFTTFQLEGRARRWWPSYLLGRPAGSPPMTWSQFTQLFLDIYTPPSEKEELRYQFEQLEQGEILVTDYEARFSELSHHALMILPTDVERVRRFIAGLHSGIRANMAREVEMVTFYQLVVEIARRIEGYRRREREETQQGKRARFSREFRGAPARGRGFTYSYVSSLFAHFLDNPRDSLGTLIYVSTLVGDSMVVDQIYRSCVVIFCGYETRADLLLLDMIDFEVILGMDWLSPYHDVLDCRSKTITLAMPELSRLDWKGSSVSTASQVISFLKDRHMVEKGYLACLPYVWDTTVESPTIDSVPVVWEFTDVFPSNLPGMPPDHDIDLAPGTQPIFIPPYYMAPK